MKTLFWAIAAATLAFAMAISLNGCARLDRYQQCQQTYGGEPDAALNILGPLGGAIIASTPAYQAWSRNMDACMKGTP